MAQTLQLPSGFTLQSPAGGPRGGPPASTGEIKSSAPSIKKVGKEIVPFETKLTPDEEQSFKIWKAQNAPRDSGEDYDLRGAFKAGVEADIKTGHWPDTFKKPNHPTFSNESQYYKDAPEKAGSWGGPNKDQFIPAGMPNVLLPAGFTLGRSTPADAQKKVSNAAFLDLQAQKFPTAEEKGGKRGEATIGAKPLSSVMIDQSKMGLLERAARSVIPGGQLNPEVFKTTARDLLSLPQMLLNPGQTMDSFKQARETNEAKAGEAWQQKDYPQAILRQGANSIPGGPAMLGMLEESLVEPAKGAGHLGAAIIAPEAGRLMKTALVGRDFTGPVALRQGLARGRQILNTPVRDLRNLPPSPAPPPVSPPMGGVGGAIRDVGVRGRSAVEAVREARAAAPGQGVVGAYNTAKEVYSRGVQPIKNRVIDKASGTSVEALTRALRPGGANKGALDFPVDMEKAIPELNRGAEITGKAIVDLETMNAALDAVVTELVDTQKRLAGTGRKLKPVNGSPIAEAIIKEIPEIVKLKNPAEVADMITNIRNTWNRDFTIKQLNKFRSESGRSATVNAYQNQLPTGQMLLDARLASAMAMAENTAIRNLLVDALDRQMGTGGAMRDINQRFKALINVERNIDKRFPVERRQAVQNMGQQIGTLMATHQFARAAKSLFTGNVGGAVGHVFSGMSEIAIGNFLREMNSTNGQIASAFRKASGEVRKPFEIKLATDKPPLGLPAAKPGVTGTTILESSTKDPGRGGAEVTRPRTQAIQQVGELPYNLHETVEKARNITGMDIETTNRRLTNQGKQGAVIQPKTGGPAYTRGPKGKMEQVPSERVPTKTAADILKLREAEVKADPQAYLNRLRAENSITGEVITTKEGKVYARDPKTGQMKGLPEFNAKDFGKLREGTVTIGRGPDGRFKKVEASKPASKTKVKK